MSISINQTEFKKYSRESEDTLFISCIFRNTGNEPVLFRFSERYFMLQQTDESEGGFSHCFSVYPADYSRIYNRYYERTKEDFLRLAPGEELNYRGAYSVSWLCRGAPPRGDWKLKIMYDCEINESDNFYLVKSYYTETADSVFIKDAWTGKLSSNTVEFVIK